jgi:hypothetical protein
MLREKIKSRPALFAIAMTSLVLMYLPDSVVLSIHQGTTCKLIGMLLFIAALFSIIPSPNQEPKISNRTNRDSAISCIASVSLLLTNHFLNAPHWLHALLGIAAWGSGFFCWSLPRTRWTELTLVPLLAIALLQTKWKIFSAFLTIRPTILIAIFVAWVLLSLITFRLIDKRKPQLGVELH